MKLIVLINLLLSLNFNIIEKYIQDNKYIYKYQEIKEIRYVFFYNLENFDINNTEIYIADRKLNFDYEFLEYYIIDLNNYYPLSSIAFKFKFDNPNFSLKISNKDNFNIEPFAYFEIKNIDKIDINDLIIDSPEWSNIRYTFDKKKETKTVKLIN